MEPCDDFQIALEQRAAGVPPGLDADAIETHVRACVGCAEYERLIAAATASVQGAAESPTFPDQALLRKARWRLAQPLRSLAWSCFLVAACVAVALAGSLHLLLTAGGLLLVVVPARVREARARRRELEELALREVDVLALAAREAKAGQATALLSFLVYAGIALVFLIILPFAKEPAVTGSVAGVLVALAAWNLLVALPRRTREQKRFLEGRP